MCSAKNGYLVVISDRKPLAWVLTEGRMAFPEQRARTAAGLQPEDTAFIYTTRSCFGNPKVDRGRLIGEATISSVVTPLDEPITFGDRTFPVGCELVINSLAPARQGVELAPLLEQLHAFPFPQRWAAYLRRPLVPLDDHDVQLVRRALNNVTTAPEEVLEGYQRLAGIGTVGADS